MRKHGLPFARLSRLEGACTRWLLAHKGSGISCSLFTLGALYGLCRENGFSFPPALPAVWEGLFQTLGEVGAALLFAAGGHAVLLSLAACSSLARRGLSEITGVLADIPALCLLGFSCLLLPSFWGIAALAAFSLLVRSVDATLKADRTIPSEFLKTAGALRLGRWQGFWRVHVPFAFPQLVRSVMRDLPDFWLRVLGGELVLSLLFPGLSTGLGGVCLSFLKAGTTMLAAVICLVMLCVVLIVQHGLIIPLCRHGRRYEVCDLAGLKQEEPASWWSGHAVPMGVAGGILATALLVYGLWPWPDDYLSLLGPAGYLLFAILVVGMVWGVLGSWALGLSQEKRDMMQHLCLAGALVPVFCLFPFMTGSVPGFFLPVFSVLGLSGWVLLQYGNGSRARHLVLMGQALRLPRLSRWKQVCFPLVCPALLQSGVVVLPFFWDNLCMAFLFGGRKQHDASDSILFVMFRDHAYLTQGIFLCLMTLLATSVRRGGFIPLQERMARRYRI